MRPLYNVIVRYANGSEDQFPFDQYRAVRDFYQYGISYGGDRVRRVEVDILGGGVRAIWDSSWDELSKAEGLMR